MTGFELLKIAGALQKVMEPQWMFTVKAPEVFAEGQRVLHVPGYQQIDNVTGPESAWWSSSPTSMRRKGYHVPDVSGLNTGKYNVTEAANRLWRLDNIGRVMPSEFGMHSLEGAMSLANVPALTMTATNKLDTARMLNSWRRNQMRTNPALALSFRRLRNPTNWSLLKSIGVAARIAR